MAQTPTPSIHPAGVSQAALPGLGSVARALCLRPLQLRCPHPPGLRRRSSSPRRGASGSSSTAFCTAHSCPCSPATRLRLSSFALARATQACVRGVWSAQGRKCHSRWCRRSSPPSAARSTTSSSRRPRGPCAACSCITACSTAAAARPACGPSSPSTSVRMAAMRLWPSGTSGQCSILGCPWAWRATRRDSSSASAALTR
mmetsp:Transcript_17276/g.53593  ORF Transcript_17276/g.53593 Transcript_17276/m.53593 type:complete len:201 (-) Transcript_17276:789-1391(-)